MPRLVTAEPPGLREFELEIFGPPRILRNGLAVSGLRHKDLALLFYLGILGPRTYSRSSLASMFWGDAPEPNARHSLTQAFRRILDVVTGDCLRIGRTDVEWLPSAPATLRILAVAENVDASTFDPSQYCGQLLEGFAGGSGAEEFDRWLERRRSETNQALLKICERIGTFAERNQEFERAAEIARTALTFDPYLESAHRRLMRAYVAQGERSRALRHYQQLKDVLKNELDHSPDPETVALASQIQLLASNRGNAAGTQTHYGAKGLDRETVPNESPVRSEEEPRHAPIPIARTVAPRPPLGLKGLRFASAAGLLLVISLGIYTANGFAKKSSRSVQEADPPYPAGPFSVGESRTVYFAHGMYYYRFPDSETVRVCYPGTQLEQRKLFPPLRFAGDFPSVRTNSWLGGTAAIVSDDDPTVYIVKKCLKRGIATESLLAAVLGANPWSKVRLVPSEISRGIPTGLPVDFPEASAADPK